jgi:hypothetical protein
MIFRIGVTSSKVEGLHLARDIFFTRQRYPHVLHFQCRRCGHEPWGLRVMDVGHLSQRFPTFQYQALLTQFFIPV